jgi:hypothetical protein
VREVILVYTDMRELAHERRVIGRVIVVYNYGFQ